VCQDWKGDQEEAICTTLVQMLLFKVWGEIKP